jgi:hypothetical protein
MASTAEKKVSKAVVIRSLQQVLEEKQKEYEVLLSENQSLRTREVCVRQWLTTSSLRPLPLVLERLSPRIVCLHAYSGVAKVSRTPMPHVQQQCWLQC